MTGPNANEGLGAYRLRLDRQVNRLADELARMGFDPAPAGAGSAEAGIVDAALSTIRQMVELLHLEPGRGWCVQAGNLIAGMTIDYSPMQRAGTDEPTQLTVKHVGPACDGMVRILSEAGFLTIAIADDFTFDLISVERSALEEAIVGAEHRRLDIADDPDRHGMQRRNISRRAC